MIFQLFLPLLLDSLFLSDSELSVHENAELRGEKKTAHTTLLPLNTLCLVNKTGKGDTHVEKKCAKKMRNIKQQALSAVTVDDKNNNKVSFARNSTACTVRVAKRQA